MKEREINLIDLLFDILLKWRIIIVFMIIGGLLLGGYSYMQSAKSIEAQLSQQSSDILSDEETLALLEEKLTIEEKEKVNMALEYANYEGYYNESLVMQIDGNSTPTSVLLFDIQAPVEIKGELALVYEQTFKAGMLEWLVQDGMDEAEASKINELVVATQFEQAMTEPKGLILINVIHVDEDSCKALADIVKEYIDAKQKQFVTVYGEHEVVLISESYATNVSTDILSKQRSALVSITDSNAKIAALEKEFTEDQKQYYALLQKDVTAETEETEEETETVISSPAVSMKFVAVGMALFAFLYVGFVFVMYIFNNRLRASDDWATLYDIPLLGMVTGKDVKKKFLGFVDRWILRLRNRNKREFTAEESKEIASVAIKVAAKKSDCKEVHLIGCELKKQANEICTGIQNMLKEDNIKIEMLDNVLYNAEEMDKLTNVQCAVLVEKIGSTMYEEVEKELELLKRNNITVLGAVLVD